MIIKARHIPFFVRFFSFYSRNGLKRHFNDVIFECNVSAAGRPLLLIGNHFSWWDGFIAYRLNDLFLHKKFHIMMLEEQLESRLFLNKAGAFSIKRGSRSVVETLSYTSGLLHDADNMVVVYPQGVITSIHRRPVQFERGTERIIAGASDKLMILFYVALPDWYSEKKPGLYVRVIEYTARERSITDLEEAYNMFLDECISNQIPS
ncbi:MAG: 1-acyl-sn-glycerol-3-phosphate acyltransferase [Bacteroidales bacterium]|jgi:1-acyl-sn-glycerol-3-phosphate acyltransferase|nr:lysophospholipid acyltransferase family protein [Bacteroidales bacterium]MCB9027574.1 1-acyl-sn-glycerol-3-phosphate acyltransferase [Bacteroidales bacterium]NLD63264.1 glycerol acyltransferase [Bacteroidales bacterium]HNT93601.1 lysophospholipid acyltransferase family protein [Bacteroidales bacterium]HOO65385.1 lysophospholipid acyltransferase family protein [Bacteroidales bacterium]